MMKPVHDLKEFFINENMILIRLLTVADPFAENQLREIIDNDHFVCVGEISIDADRSLLDYCRAEDGSSAVFIALSEATATERPNKGVVGIALYIKNPVTLSHEMALLVHPSFLSTRLALEMLDSLVADAAENGVSTLTTSDSNDDIHMRRIADKLGMSSRLAPGNYKHTRYTLQVDKHPGIVVF